MLLGRGIVVALTVLVFLPFAPADRPCQGKDPDSPPRTIPDFSLSDAGGVKHTAAEWKDRKAVVLFFIAKECPISNGYAPEYSRLAKAFGERGVNLFGVQSDPEVTAAEQLEHAKEYGLAFPILMDPHQVLAKAAGIHVTPEAVLLAPDGKVHYRGRIDDRITEDGKRRDEPRIRDLQDALEAVLAGKTPPVAETKAFGCPLPRPRPDESPKEKKP
jgi:peroxiredoxin